MEKNVTSKDSTQICYELAGNGETALLFVHGWLGNKRWWDSQRNFFSHKYLIVQLDLAGHGEAGKSREVWSSEQYANDIVAVAKSLPSKNLILIGHSMSGAYATEAAVQIPNVKALILVDTLTDLDQMMSIEQANQIFDVYRRDFKEAVENILPQYLFTNETPPKIKAQLQKEFLTYDSDFAVKALEPLFKTDVREFASSLKIPVRAINSDMEKTNTENNRKYFHDYDYTLIKGSGHYPMLERPEEFNLILDKILQGL